jgi:hypothetical protein
MKIVETSITSATCGFIKQLIVLIRIIWFIFIGLRLGYIDIHWHRSKIASLTELQELSKNSSISWISEIPKLSKHSFLRKYIPKEQQIEDQNEDETQEESSCDITRWQRPLIIFINIKKTPSTEASKSKKEKRHSNRRSSVGTWSGAPRSRSKFMSRVHERALDDQRALDKKSFKPIKRGALPSSLTFDSHLFQTGMAYIPDPVFLKQYKRYPCDVFNQYTPQTLPPNYYQFLDDIQIFFGYMKGAYSNTVAQKEVRRHADPADGILAYILPADLSNTLTNSRTHFWNWQNMASPKRNKRNIDCSNEIYSSKALPIILWCRWMKSIVLPSIASPE